MKTRLLLGIMMFATVLVSCNKESQDEPEDLIEGKWTIYSQEILGSTTPGDGSYLTFSGGLSGTGTDYRASDGTTGTFTYSMNEAGTVVDIVDTIADGGNYNFTFDILELSDDKFRFTANTGIFGNMLIEMEK